MRGTRLQVGVVLGFLGFPEVFLRRCWSGLGRREGLLVGFRSPGMPFRWCFVVQGRSPGSQDWARGSFAVSVIERSVFGECP